MPSIRMEATCFRWRAMSDLTLDEPILIVHVLASGGRWTAASSGYGPRKTLYYASFAGPPKACGETPLRYWPRRAVGRVDAGLDRAKARRCAAGGKGAQAEAIGPLVEVGVGATLAI